MSECAHENCACRYHDNTPTEDAVERVASWQPIETAPVGCHFVAAYFWNEGGEWVYDIATLHRDHACGSNEGAGPFTHWRPLPEPPAITTLEGGSRL